MDLDIEVLPDVERIVCRDDGEGMTFDHARAFLFTLYASSKESASNQAGRFGVGFWSVLRFSPERIVIRSCPASGPAWEVTLDGDLQSAERRQPAAMERGTVVVLERPTGDGNLARRVYDAAWQSARYLCQRDSENQPLQIRVNGESANSAFRLPAPSVAFRRGAFRGVIGLGSAPRVELFSRGLRVRSAATLQDLLSAKGRHTDRSRVHFPDLPSGLAPQAILESGDLDVLLSRGDVRDNRALRRLVRRAHTELTRLVRRQLALRRPWWARWTDTLRERFSGVALGFALGALATIPLAWWALKDVPIREQVGALLGGGRGGAPTQTTTGPQPYQDIAAAYSGPQVDVLPARGPDVDLQYQPRGANPRFVTLVVETFDDDGVPQIENTLHPYPGRVCTGDCIDVSLGVRSPGGAFRVPVPTGHVIEPGSLELDGKPLTLAGASESGQPVAMFDGPTEARLTYRTGPAPIHSHNIRNDIALPARLRPLIRTLKRRSPGRRADYLREYVETNVSYANSARVAARHVRAQRNGQSFVNRALEIGAGDCDVQNGLLTILLQKAGVPAHLAIGYIGRQGTVAPQLHAWVEYDDGSESWQIADASQGSAPVLLGRAPNDAATTATTPVAGVVSQPATPGPAAGTASGGSATTAQPASRLPASWAPYALLIGSGLLLIGLGLVLPQLRTRRAFELDTRASAAELLKGALQRPEAFRHITAIFHTRLIPLIGRRPVSLLRAWDLAASGQLFRSDGTSKLARRAQRRLAILDDAKPEGRTVAVSLGATDLDYWDALLERSTVPTLFARLNQYLAHSGESWAVYLAPNVGEGVATLDVGRRGILPGGVTRVVLVDTRAALLDRIASGLDGGRSIHLFLLLDAVLNRLDVPERRSAELLAPLAEHAVRYGGCR